MNEPKLIADTTDLLPALLPTAVPVKKAATLSNLWGLWIESRGPLAPNSLNLYRYIAKRFLTFFRHRQLTPENLIEWCSYLRKIRSPLTGKPITLGRINEINVRVHSFLKFLKKTGFIRHDLWEFVPLEKLPDPGMPEIITEEEYQRLKDFLANIEKWQWVLWLCILGYRSGMSLVDCCNLRWEQVFLNDEGESYMDVPRQKMRRYGEKAVCRIPIIPGSDLYEWLLKLREVKNYQRADGLNYVHQDCPGLYSNCMMPINQDIRRVFDKVGLHGKSFVTFRRTFLSNLVNSGMHYALICKISGHTNMKTLLRYLRPDRKALQDGVMKAQQYAEAKL
jgi:integrase